ncbi:MAG TPA: DUF2752 domain-containing protein [Blastocatellia bacterium]|nr:DUF2752 domain-containing protein [Blastocatellia bacterium]
MQQEIRSGTSPNDRLPYLVMACLSGAVLVTARILPPSPRGVGTHELLGLPPCFFLKLTGLPCPSCGLTTCFAHAARLHFYEALVTQPFGLLAFFITLSLIPLSCWLAYRRVPWPSVVGSRAMKSVMGLLLALWLIGWVYKIAVMR